MAVLRFEWDTRKESANKHKHGISFEEAQTVFLDEQALLVADPDHSEDEERFILLGLSRALRTLVVCHCYRGDEDTIRLISARRANPVERRLYDKRWTI
ncbi:MAG TPA: BrnT family toxin [Terriglobia bacterium]|nr:BrnT family toxin [Terriglobia bacterium]